jgi:hypothetical protein
MKLEFKESKVQAVTKWDIVVGDETVGTVEDRGTIKDTARRFHAAINLNCSKGLIQGFGALPAEAVAEAIETGIKDANGLLAAIADLRGKLSA